MGNKERQNKQSEWRIVFIFISMLLAFAFIGTAVNLQKIGTYASWGDLIKNFDVQVFFLSQPAAIYFGGLLVVAIYVLISWARK